MKRLWMGIGLLCLLSAISPATGHQRQDESIAATTPQRQTAAWAQSWWSQRHEEKLKEKETLERVDLVMIGDSITHGWETGGKEVWDKYYAERHALNLGFSGDRTEHVLWRLQHGAVDGIAPKLAVVMIGTNNAGHRQDKPEHTAAGIEAILAELKERLPKTKILLLAIFPRGATSQDPLRKINDATNERIRQLADGQHVFYLDINRSFLDEDGRLPTSIMPDLLHPEARGYQLWAEAMEPTLERLLGE